MIFPSHLVLFVLLFKTKSKQTWATRSSGKDALMFGSWFSESPGPRKVQRCHSLLEGQLRTHTHTHTPPVAPALLHSPTPNPRKHISQPAGPGMSHGQFRFLWGHKTSLLLLGPQVVAEKGVWSLSQGKFPHLYRGRGEHSLSGQPSESHGGPCSW